MFQMHVVDDSNRRAYQAELDDYFRVRHDIYVGERGWSDLARIDQREMDAFDNEDATYLLGITDDKKVVAGSRLVPTQKPHLMSEVFPDLTTGRVPRADNIYEWTRVFVVKSLRNPRRPSMAAGILYCAITEFCLQKDICSLTVVCEPYWYERLHAIGWKPRYLGAPMDHKDGAIVGLILQMSSAALAQTRSFYGITEPVLRSSRATATAGSPAADQ